MITSTSNATIRSIRSLNNRKYRDELQIGYVEGIRVVRSAIELQSHLIEKIILAPDLLTSASTKQVIQKAQKDDISIIEVSKQVFQKISKRDGPQGIAAIVRQNWTTLEDIIPENNSLWVALASSGNPGNIGTILRTLDAVGGSGIILLGPSADPWDPTSIRASTGAIFNCTLIRSNWSKLKKWAQFNNFSLIGATDEATANYRTIEYPNNTILVMGSEQSGLDIAQKKECSNLVSLPMIGSVDSLNLSVACSIILYEIMSQQMP
tara:strand:+ start:1425 stop:2219 length:795 start_codon:yes stop_codon:yes gene_type:complete